MLQQTAVVQTPPSIGTSIKTSLGQAIGATLTWLPRLLAFLLIVLVGWIVSSLLARVVATVLRAIKFNEVMARLGLADFLARMRSGRDASTLVAGAVKWIVRFIVLLVAFDALGLPAISDVLRQFLIWLPNLIVAIAVLILAGIGARALGDVVRGATSEAGYRNPDTLANVAKTAVWIFAVVIAVNQVGIGQMLVNTLFTGAVAALTLAAGLAFGMGGRDLAARKLKDWYDEAPNSAERLK
jgi:mechanosensitive ion channel-like protein